MNPLLKLHEHGQSYWLDNLTRGALRSGELARRVRHEGLRGVTSNPKTFHDAVVKDSEYDRQIEAAALKGLSTGQIYEELVVTDIQQACDVLRPAYDASEGKDGYVSLEVSPRLAHDAHASILEAERLARRVARPNLMIKIPGTHAGISAIEQLLFEGINVNITLLFSVERYLEVAAAYLRALERRITDGQSVREVHSVASFFLSRIDVLVDQLLSHRPQSPPAHGVSPGPQVLFGRTAIANAKLAYQSYKASLADSRWLAVAEVGALPQRLLWASTRPKNLAYPDLMYVEPLIGRDTVTTMPEATIAAFADHGVVADTLEQGVVEARDVLDELARLGIEFFCVTEQLENEGIQKFIEPYTALLEVLDDRRRRIQPAASQSRMH